MARKNGFVDDWRLLNLHTDILFTYDRDGRMVRSNEPRGRAAPRVLLCYTADAYLLRFGHAIPDALVRRITDVARETQDAWQLHRPPPVAATVRRLLQEHPPVTTEEAGPIYRFPRSVPCAGRAVQLTSNNVEVVRDTYPWLVTELEDWWPCCAVVRDGAAVSVCFSSRIGAGANEAGVDTRPAFRGRGFAAAATAAWCAAVRSAGRIPLYSTSWDNAASQAVARRLGLVMFGAELMWP